MTILDVPPSDSFSCPARNALPSHASDAPTNLSAPLESLPSPPESTLKLKQQYMSTDAPLSSNESPANTPDLSPASCTLSLDASLGKLKKRVDFSPWTVSTDFTDLETSIRSLPPSRECQSSKSILKLGRPPIFVQDEVHHPTEDLATMLDTILQQLAGADVQIRLDAYSTLFSSWKAYAELPGGPITKEKIQTLTDFIRRDLSRNSGEHMEPSEVNLMLTALKLQVTIVWNKTLSVYLKDSYREFLIDHSTRVLEEHKMPKATILHYLHLLSTQEFSGRIVTTGRAVRVLEVLKNLPEHVRGNGVISERLMVYNRILEQAKSAFKSRPSCWVSQLLAAMTCSINDTRKKAINLGNRTAVLLGSSSTVTTALRDIMDGPGEQQEVLSSTICKRLGRMMKTVDEARQVPQIWAVVILLMRGLEQRFNEWHRLHDWLRIIQKCFNSSDSEVRVAANRAWNKLVFVARPYEGTKSFLTKMLMKPILVQLERPNNDKQSKGTRNSAFATYCNLLYYSLRPSASSSHYDSVWDEYIVPAFRAPFLSNEQNSDRACRILLTLFWREKISPWRENRALDSVFIEPEELPPLDCKWIRSRTRSILEVFELLFRSSCWGSAAYSVTAYIAVAWQNFAKALGDACRKEVRASSDTTEGVVHISRFLIRICQKSQATMKGAEDAYASRFHFICKTMLLELGPISFAEGTLPRAIDGASVASTSKSNLKGRPLMADVLAGIQNLPQTSKDGQYFDMVIDLLQLTSKARSSVKGRVHFYKQCAQAVSANESRGLRPRLSWNAISELTCGEVANGAINSSDDGADVDDIVTDIVKILELGVPHQSGQSEAWSALLKKMLVVADGFHRSGMPAIERLTTHLKNQTSEQGGLCTAVLIQEFLEAFPLSAIFPARTANSKATQKQQEKIMHVYRGLFSLLDLHLSRVYSIADFSEQAIPEALVDVAISLLRAPPTEGALAYLTGSQESLALWLEDNRRLMTPASRAGSLKLLQARRLCPVVIEVLGKLSKEIELKSLDRLFAAAFKTSHKIIVNHMVEMWNSAYGTKKSLEYGDMLKEALARLVPFVGLELPGFADVQLHAANSPVVDYLGIPDDVASDVCLKTSPPSRDVDQRTALPGVDNWAQQEHSDETAAEKSRATIMAGYKQSRRHDDSQMHFVSIVSSSPPRQEHESQNLTARQKEVRARQDREAALLFPDFRSSPVSNRMTLKTEEEAHSSLHAGGGQDLYGTPNPATPTVPSRHSLMYEEAVHASPTPKSKHQALRLEEIDVPSSPLSMQAPIEQNHQPEARIHSDCPDEVQNVPEKQRVSGVEFSEEIAGEPSFLDPDLENALPEIEEDPSKTSPSMKQCHEQTQTVQRTPECLGDKITDTPEALPPTQAQVGDDILWKKFYEHDLEADVIAAANSISNEGLQRTSEQSPDVSGLLLKVTDTTADLETARTSPQTDGSNETRPETTFDTPMNINTPPEHDLKVHSDDNDFWSASQLSQDLERAAGFAPSPVDRGQSEVAPSVPAKRKQSPAAPQATASKRRRATTTLVRPRQTPKVSSTAPKLHSSQEIYDCIEVDTPSSPQSFSRAASTASQTSVVLQPTKRGRGRPRKTQTQADMPGPAAVKKSLDEGSKSGNDETPPKIEVCISAEGGRNLSQVPTEADESSLDLGDNPNRVLNATNASNRDTARRRSGTEVRTDDKENQVPAEEAMELLQKALSSLKNIRMDRSKLRAIDDLVFEIRTEAQNAAQRNAENGT
jgi:Rap1-interacting factor 1 N terminal